MHKWTVGLACMAWVFCALGSLATGNVAFAVFLILWSISIVWLTTEEIE